MKIEILYVPGCPNYEPAVERVRKTLLAEAVQGEIRGVAINSQAGANAQLFPGSPTIRINGNDVEAQPGTTPSLACRLYANQSGLPSECCARPFRRPSGRSELGMRTVERATPVAAVIAALATLGCCLPLGFLGAAGLAGASLWLAPIRPWLLGAAAVLLGVSFIKLYVRRSQCRRRSALSMVIFWAAAAVVVLVILMPQLVASLIAG